MERLKFDDRFKEFMDSDLQNSKVIGLKGDILSYRTEEIIPEKTNSNTPLLLLFGNPAPQSIIGEMFFASESNGREHRIWGAFHKTGFIKFHWLKSGRKKELYELTYGSPFRIGLAVFYSMPSPASDKKWGGVAGLHRLFGTKAFEMIRDLEKKRIDKIIQNFVEPNGAIIAFQKDAYLAVKSPPAEYDILKAKQGLLKGTCECNQKIKLLCAPPTRLIQSTQAIAVLEKLRKQCEVK